MATIKFFSESEEFLEGVETGINFSNDSAITSKGISSTDDKYGFCLTMEDLESEEDKNKYYNGSSFDYEAIA